MVTFEEIPDDRSMASLEKAVERLRLQVAFAERGVQLPEGLAITPENMLAGFASPEDFEVRDRSMEYTNGDSYKGEMLGSLRHGRGVHSCSNGDRYEGEWRYDKRHGRGRMEFARGLVYDGDWREDKAHGHAACRYENGAVYEGEYAGDVRCGWGWLRHPGGEAYEGEWAADKMHGSGCTTYPDGSRFQGQFEGGARKQGTFTAGDGSSEASGTWDGELLHGQGVLYQRGLRRYCGDFVHGEPHGTGQCEYPIGSRYDGQWREGQRHGRGRLVGPGGALYDGDWAADRQHGRGTAVLASGEQYLGDFKEGLRHGSGRCVYPDGSKYEGGWERDQRSGQGTCHFANGDRYRGGWKADKRHGLGVCKFADGTKFRGEWEEGEWVQSSADPARCRVAGPGVTRATAGQPAQLLIEARDDAGNRRLSGGDEFSVQLRSKAACVTGTVTDAGDGTYSVEYTATVAGVYQLCITTGPPEAEEHVADSPYPLRMLPGPPSPRHCSFAGEGRARAVVGKPASFEVLAHDALGNRWFGQGLQRALPLEIELSCCGAACEVQVEATPDGRYACAYLARAPGFYRLHVTHRGAPLPGTPLSVFVLTPEEARARLVADATVPAPADSSTACTDSSTGPGTSMCPWPRQAAPRGLEMPKKPESQPGVRDRVSEWARIAAELYAADGDATGWDSEEERRRARETPEERYRREHPNVPVVENLEDIWLVTKLQNERKAKAEAEKRKRLQELASTLESRFGPGRAPQPEEVQAAVKELVEADIRGQAQQAQQAQQASGAGQGEAAVPGQQAQRGRGAAAPAAGPSVLSELAAQAALLDELD